MRHKHHDLIVAKAANMDLVVFSQNQKDGSWLIQNDQGTTDFGDCVNYFLCLPQHKEACLHWLSGFDVEYQDYPAMKWSTIKNKGACSWGFDVVFMQDNLSIRIKTYKENRYIAIRRHDLYVESIAYKTEDEAIANNNPKFWNVYEIEVEVENGQSN